MKDDAFVEYIVESLGDRWDCVVKPLFGGVSLQVDGKKIGSVLGGVFYLKVINADLQKRYADEGSEQFSYRRKDKKDPIIIKNWWSVDENILDRPESLRICVQEILEQEELI